MIEEYPAGVTASKPALPGLDERYLTVKGVSVRYFAGGSGGPPVVLVHGLGGAAVNWSAVAPALAERHTVIVPDLPGHGGSAGVPALPNLAPFAEIVHEVAAHEQALPAVVAGHSLGAVVAVRHAVRYADHTLGIVLAGAAGISSSTRSAEVLLAFTALVQPGRRLAPYRRRIARKAWLRTAVFGGWGATDPAALEPRLAEALLADVPLHTDVGSASATLVRDPVTPQLARVCCPALVVWGSGDAQVPVDDAYTYARDLGAELRVIGDCGHLLVAERGDACVDAIESLCARVSL